VFHAVAEHLLDVPVAHGTALQAAQAGNLEALSAVLPAQPQDTFAAAEGHFRMGEVLQIVFTAWAQLPPTAVALVTKESASRSM